MMIEFKEKRNVVLMTVSAKKWYTNVMAEICMETKLKVTKLVRKETK